jgi:arylsulfatase A-like enzyme/Flp pilus assembly protein TadD
MFDPAKTRALAASLGILVFLAVGSCSRSGRGGDPVLDEQEAVGPFPGAPVILISIDTLRSDHLPAYGYGGVETPNIDRLHGDGVLFTRAYTHSPLTLPSHVSMLTGLLPADHGVRNNIGFVFDPARHATIPSMLAAGGYATGAAVSAYVLRAETGLGPLFDAYDDAFLVLGEEYGGALERAGGDTVKAARPWIEGHFERPFFYFLHLFEPHTPYDPPQLFRSRFPLAYDGEIATADAAVGEFLALLQQIGVYDRAVVVLLSDHGEGLGDHGEDEHGIFLYRDTIQVPLIVKLPRGELGGTTVDQPVQLIDLLPTVTALVGGGSPAGFPGRSLFAGQTAGTGTPAIVAETWVPRIHFGWSELWSLIDGRLHYIAAPRPELYDLVDDPGELHNLLDSNPDDGSRLAASLQPFIRGLEEAAVIDPEEAERLAALGYIGVAAAPVTGPLPDPKDRVADLVLLKSATTLAAEGRSDEAVATLQRVLETNPGFTAGWLQLARINQQSGRLPEAIAAYETTIGLAPALTAQCGAALASIHLQLRQYDQAEAWARRCIAAGSAVGHLQLGRILFARGDLEGAEAEARSAMHDPLQRVVGAVLLAEVLAGRGKVDEALAAADGADAELRTRGLDPVPRLHMVRGDLFGRRERFDEAEAEFLTEIRWFPDNLTAYTDLAVVYYVTRRTDQARATLERMVQANPHPISMMLAARTAARIGDTRTADAWQQRIDALPRTP